MLNKMRLLDFGPENQNLLLSISTISIYQNLPISIFQIVGGMGGLVYNNIELGHICCGSCSSGLLHLCLLRLLF
jgi:hypothetical protein